MNPDCGELRVCMLLYNYWPGAVGGAERQCQKLSKNLCTQRVSCTVLTARHSWSHPVRECDEGVILRRLHVAHLFVSPLVSGFQVLRKFRLPNSPEPLQSEKEAPASAPLQQSRSAGIFRWLNICSFIAGVTVHLAFNRKKYDVLHVHIADWLAGYVGWLGPKLSLPVLVKAANSPPLHPIAPWTPFRHLIEKGRMNVHYVALHEEMKRELTVSGIPASNIRVVPNGVDLVEQPPEMSIRSSVLFVGNFTQGVQHKGFDVLLNAWANVVQEVPSAELILAGRGEASFWKAESERLGIADTVKFAGYQLSLEAFYREAALFVLPSRHEGMSNALLEAQSYGVPVVASDIPANKAVVDDGVSGFLVPVGDPETLAQKIVVMLQDPTLRATMGTNARENIQNRFIMQKIASTYRKAYEEIAC